MTTKSPNTLWIAAVCVAALLSNIHTAHAMGRSTARLASVELQQEGAAKSAELAAVKSEHADVQTELSQLRKEVQQLREELISFKEHETSPK